jgi:murein tripeptide amidase MpaA
MIDVTLVEEMIQERMKDSVVPLVNKDKVWDDNDEANKKLEENFPWIGSDEALSEAVEPEVVERLPPENQSG